MFAMQIVDDRLENGLANHPDLVEVLEGQNETLKQDAKFDVNSPEEDQDEQMKQKDCPEGLHYDDKLPYEEFDRFTTPSNDEPECICMMHELENSTSWAPLQFEEAEWQVQHDAIRACYQHGPWTPNDSIEFSLLNGITYSRCCEICANYKEHMLITQVMEESNFSAW